MGVSDLEQQGSKVAGNLLHVSIGCRISYTVLKRSWLPFCFCPILITLYLRTKDERHQALRAINNRVPGVPGNEARLDSGLKYGLNFGLDFGLNSIM